MRRDMVNLLLIRCGSVAATISCRGSLCPRQSARASIRNSPRIANTGRYHSAVLYSERPRDATRLRPAARLPIHCRRSPMSTIRSHLGFIRNVALLALSIAILVLGVWTFRTTHAQASPGVVDNNLLAVSLIRSGLPAENLCAAGVSSQAVSGVVHDFEEALAGDSLALPSADSALATARIQEDDLSRMVRAGKATPEQVSALPAAATQLQSAQTQRENELNDLFTAGAADLSTIQRTL